MADGNKGQKNADKVYAQGPKLKIKDFGTPPGSPPQLLSLLDSFQQLRDSLRGSLPRYKDPDPTPSELLDHFREDTRKKKVAARAKRRAEGKYSPLKGLAPQQPFSASSGRTRFGGSSRGKGAESPGFSLSRFSDGHTSGKDSALSQAAGASAPKPGKGLGGDYSALHDFLNQVESEQKHQQKQEQQLQNLGPEISPEEVEPEEAPSFVLEAGARRRSSLVIEEDPDWEIRRLESLASALEEGAAERRTLADAPSTLQSRGEPEESEKKSSKESRPARQSTASSRTQYMDQGASKRSSPSLSPSRQSLSPKAREASPKGRRGSIEPPDSSTKGSEESLNSESLRGQGAKTTEGKGLKLKVEKRKPKLNISSGGRKGSVNSTESKEVGTLTSSQVAELRAFTLGEGDNISEDSHFRIQQALDLAEHMLLAKGPTNGRIEMEQYLGSKDLTFPAIHKRNHIDALELDEEEVSSEGKTQKQKWEHHAKARATGVAAMEHLLERHQKMKAEKETAEQELTLARQTLANEKELTTQLRDKISSLRAERSDLQKTIYRTNKAREKEKAEQGAEMAKLHEQMKSIKSQLDTTLDEKESLQYNFHQLEISLKKQQDAVSTLRRELADKQSKDRDESARVAALVQDNATLKLDKERLERELELLDEDFHYAKQKLQSCQDYVERVTKDHNDKLRALNEKLGGRLRETEKDLDSESNQRQELEALLAKAQHELALYKDRYEVSDAELQNLKRANHETMSKLDSQILEIRMAKVKIQWSWLINLYIVQAAFPHNQEKSCQTDLGASVHQEVQTDYVVGSSEFARYWGEAVMVSERMDLKVADYHSRMTLSELLGFISNTYSRKCMADVIDQRSHFPRQTLQEFLQTYYVETTASRTGAFRNLAELIANVNLYCRLAQAAKMAKGNDPAPTKGKGKSQEGEGLESESTSALINAAPRLMMFARFIGARGGGLEDPYPNDAFDLFLATLIRLRKGQTPLLINAAERMMIVTEEFVGVIEMVLMYIKSHERERMKGSFNRDVALGKTHVDLDTGLQWLIERWKELVYDRQDERLSSLFAAADINGDGLLDFSEYWELIRKLRMDQKEILPMRQLLKLYGRMALAPRIDTRIFVKIAREWDLCAFHVGSSEDSALITQSFKIIEQEWKTIEPAIMAMIKKLDWRPEGQKLLQDVQVLRKVLKDKHAPDVARHYLFTMTRDFNVPANLLSKTKDLKQTTIEPSRPTALKAQPVKVSQQQRAGAAVAGSGASNVGDDVLRGAWAEIAAEEEAKVKKDKGPVSKLVGITDEDLLGMDAGMPTGPPVMPTFS